VAGRHSKDQTRRVDRLSEAQYLALVLVIVLGILVLLAGVGYGIYLLTTLGILLGDGIVLAAYLPVFVWSFVDRDSRRNWRSWSMPAVMLELIVQFMTALAGEHHWAAAQRHGISLAGDVVSWGVVPVCLAIAVFVSIPPDRRHWPWRRGGPGAPVASPPGQS
jgi:hypothetical protein